MVLQAIQTTYNGYRFRSRLEARWAIFFEVLGLDFHYEAEGYILRDNKWYLPDFYFPTVKMFAEVKPDIVTKRERRSCELLALDSKKPVLMLAGPPDYRNYNAYQTDPWSDTALIYDYSLVPFFLPERFPCLNFAQQSAPETYGGRYRNAVEAARAARFEHEPGLPPC